MEEKFNKNDIVTLSESNLSYEDLLLRLKSYSVILENLQYVSTPNFTDDFSLVNFVISRNIAIICDCLQKFA